MIRPLFHATRFSMMTSRFFEKPQGEVTWYRCKALENKAQKTNKMRKAFSVSSALHPKADVLCEKLQCQQWAQSEQSCSLYYLSKSSSPSGSRTINIKNAGQLNAAC
jgi:hypothetical protein